MSLFDELTEKLSGPSYVAVIMESELDPVQGAGAPVAPPTYAAPRGETGSRIASTEDARIPVPGQDGWHHAWASKDGEPRLGTRVVLNSLAACAGDAETALWHGKERLGVALPGFVVSGASVTAERIADSVRRLKHETPTTTALSQVARAVGFEVSTWELAHRTADSWLMYAQGESDQIWAEGGEIKDILLSISHGRGDLVYRVATNSGVFGSWLSAGTALRSPIPRSYACEITGFGAKPVNRGATKLDPTGGTTKKGAKILIRGDGIVVVDNSTKEAKGLSDLGFGQVPGHPQIRAMTCEVILRQASISFKALDLFQFPDDPDGQKKLAAKRVFVLLAMAGHVMAGENGFLRSGCDLLTADERWGWRRHGRRTPENLPVPTRDELSAALGKAVAAATEVGLEFDEVRTVGLSDAELDLIVDRVLIEDAKGGLGEAAD